MSQPKIIFYRIMPSLGRDGASCVRWALSQWEKSLSGRIKFKEFGFGANWQFEISEIAGYPRYIAYHNNTGKDSSLIQFDPRVKWAASWFHRMFTDRICMRKLALHEIGHALGLVHNKGDVNSIMNPAPRTAEIDKESIESVRI